MTKSATAPVEVTARQVREFYAADPRRVERLPEHARASVALGVRGPLHADAIADHNRARRTKVYRKGATGRAVAESRAAAKARRAAAEAAGVSVGKRGRLSAEALAALGE